MVLKYNRQSHILWFVAINMVAIIFLSRIRAGRAHHLRANAYKSAQSRASFTISVNGVCVVDIGCAEFMWVEFPKRRDLIQENGYFC